MSDQFIYQRIGNHMLAMSPDKPLLTQYDPQSGKLEIQAIFTPLETLYMRALMEWYPYYCPYEILLVIARGKREEYWQKIIWEIRNENGLLTPVIKPLIDAMCEIRKKLKPFAITIGNNVDAGYEVALKKEERKSHVA